MRLTPHEQERLLLSLRRRVGPAGVGPVACASPHPEAIAVIADHILKAQTVALFRVDGIRARGARP